MSSVNTILRPALGLGFGSPFALPGEAAGGGGGGGSSLLTGLQAWWDLPGGDVNQTDDSANGNTLIPANTPGQIVGGAPDGANCANFVRANTEHYSITDASQTGLSPGSGGFGFSVWAYFDGLSNFMAVMAKDSFNLGEREWQLRYNSSTSKMQFLVLGVTSGEIAVDSDTFSFSINTWYHFSGGIDTNAQQIGLAINAGTLNTAALAEAVLASTSDFAIGATGEDGAPMDGRIAAAGVWNRMPTASERTTLYGDGSGARHPWS